MRTEVIQADTIDAGVERILEELKDDTSTRSSRNRENVIYFDGWDGLGASSVLQAVAQRLGASSAPKKELAQAGLHFERIIHIDCTKWQSRRAMQRLIAVQLDLPASVMEVFDKQDEEDDYRGVDPGSRAEIPEVVREIYRRLQNLRFLVLFHNGSSEEIDLANSGFPLQDLGFALYSRNKVLWTFQGSFRLKPRMKIDQTLSKSTGMTTGVFLSASHHERDPQELWSYLVLKEAEEVARKNNTGCITEPAQVAECFLYMLKQCWLGQHLVDYDLATHGGNYWVCDGIIQQLQEGETDDDYGLWRDAAALQSEMQLDVEYYQHRHQQYVNLQRCAENMPYWSSPPYLLIPVGAAAFLNGDVLKHFNTLGVLKLSRCNFSFSSPPFLCCHKLRLLWLEHCQDQAISTDRAAEKDQLIQQFFQRLWVLDVRYMRCDRILSAWMLDFMSQLRELNVVGAQDLDMGQLQGRLPNIRKLRVTQSTVGCSSCSKNNLIPLGMDKMELLDFSGNRTTMPGVANKLEMSTFNECLETVTITDGCVGIRNFSFKGCAKLKHLLLSGLFEDLRILDLSGTSIKMLDLSTMTARNLDELFLDGCEKLCAILWPPQEERKSYLQKLHIDTTQSAAASSVELHGALPPSDYYWYISTKDARLLRSLVPFRNDFERIHVHVEISSPNCHAVDVGGSRNEAVIKSGISGGEQPNVQNQQINDNALIYSDVAVTIEGHLFQASQGYGNAQTITQIWPCPAAPKLDSSNCYMYIQDKAMMNISPPDHEEYATGNTITIPDFVCDRAWILHVHDSLSITGIPGHARWTRLEWCLVERCPKLDFIFTVPQLGTEQGGGSSDMVIFYWLSTLWISQLPKARFMWDMCKLSLGQISNRSFEDLEMLHLDFCPRLIHVLPFSMLIIGRRLLETIEIVWCGNLRTLFPLHSDTEIHQEQQQTPGATTVEFPHLKRIHLHDLPKLQSFCGSGRMYAPNLETIKIRGCWSLTRLPAVSSKKVECDCEEDWWEMLQWDGLQANHHPSLYRPTHPRYYKKILLRGSVLV